jgi:hypothetical protein
LAREDHEIALEGEVGANDVGARRLDGEEEWRKADWGRGLFDLPQDDRDEFTPLPPSRQ